MTIISIWVIISVIITILIIKKYKSKKDLSYRKKVLSERNKRYVSYRKKVLSENIKKDLSRGTQGTTGSQSERGLQDTQGTTDCNEYLSYKDLYKDLLKREEWREKRAKILNRDNNKCVYCGEVHNLQVHHKYYCQYPNGYRVRPWNYPDDALITLCDKCHTKVHNKKKIKVYYRSYSENYLT